MVDSGSTVNLLKLKSYKCPIRGINEEDTASLTGIHPESLLTLGSVKLNMLNKPTKFHLVNSNVSFPADGLIGTPFLEQHKMNSSFKFKSLQWSSI